MTDARFTKDHEYVRVSEGVGVVGISDFAQSQLGDIVYVELPAVGAKINKGEQLATVESVKSANEVYAPVSGEVVEVNSDLENAPASVNEDPLGKGWFVKLRLTDESELASLMDASAYEGFIKTL